MRNFNKGGMNRGRGREERGMHRATCADCGRSCEVPFKPSGGKPVYCSNCFDKGSSGSGGKRNYSEKPSFGRDSYGAGKRPSFSKRDDYGKRDDYAKRDDYGRGERSFSKRDNFSPAPDNSAKKYDEMNAKLDKIVILLERLVSSQDKSRAGKVDDSEQKAPKAPKAAKVAKEAKEKKTAAKKVSAKKPAATKKKVAKKSSK